MDITDVLVITQARTQSTRFPGKVLHKIGGKTLLQYQVDRIRSAGLSLACATTVEPADDMLCAHLDLLGIPYIRGSQDHVLSRFYDAAKHFKPKVIVRITSDCPLIDGSLISQSVEKYLENNDSKLYMSNVVQRTFPRGLDFEIFSYEMLEDTFQSATSQYDIEHVTPFMRNNIPQRFHGYDIVSQNNRSDIRITVDEEKDMELMTLLIESYHADHLSHEEIVALFEKNPHLLRINEMVKQK